MRLNLTTELTSVTDGKVLKDGKEDVTLGLVCCNALLIADKADAKAEDKVKKFNMAVKLSGKDSVEVIAEDVVLLKSCINTAYQQPLIVGQAFNLLDACGGVKEPAVLESMPPKEADLTEP